MKIAVITLTRDRLAYTKMCFKSLEDKSGYPYNHYIWDNGSEDSTQEWLRFYGSLQDPTKFPYFGTHNVGIARAMNSLKSIILHCDLVIKMDNDCLVLTDNILAKIVKLYSHLGEPWILSPKVGGLMKPPTPIGETIQITDSNPKSYMNFSIAPAWIGGIFRVMPYDLFMDFTADESLPKAYGVDGQMHKWCEKKGIKMGYINELEVEHYKTTEGQMRDFPEYFVRKFREEKAE